VAEQEDQNKPHRDKRSRKWFLRVLVLLAAALVVLVFLSISGRWGIRTAEKKLAAINAARAIPDEENAARIYHELLESYDEAEFSFYLMDTEAYYVTLREPWLSRDHPQLAEWLEDRREGLAKLFEASQIRECRFPLPTVPEETSAQNKRLRAMRLWALLLACGANNDVAEGRIDTGLEKYLCIIQMAKHLYQQPTMSDFLIGLAIEFRPLRNCHEFIVEHDIVASHLMTIELALSHTTNNWDRD
jgi:hypothetical protein